MRRHFHPFQWYDYAFLSCSPCATWPLQGVNSQTQAGNNGTSGFLRYTQDFCGTHRIFVVPGTAVPLNYRYLRNTRYYLGTLPWQQAVLASRIVLCLIGIKYIESSVLITRSTYCVLNLASRTGLSRSTKLSRSDVINLVHVDLLYLQMQVPSRVAGQYYIYQQYTGRPNRNLVEKTNKFSTFIDIPVVLNFTTSGGAVPAPDRYKNLYMYRSADLQICRLY